MRMQIVRLSRCAWRIGLAGALLFCATSAGAAHTCTVSVGLVNFGAFTGVQKTSSATMTVTCTLTGGFGDTINFTAALTTGSGSYAQRLLTHVGAPPDTLNYNLYLGTVPAILNTSVWGDGSGTTVTASGTLQLTAILNPVRSATFTVAAAMAALAALPTAGTYQDLPMAIVTYN
jgi:hypothetical protein